MPKRVRSLSRDQKIMHYDDYKDQTPVTKSTLFRGERVEEGEQGQAICASMALADICFQYQGTKGGLV